jgi:hypothetical protein
MGRLDPGAPLGGVRSVAGSGDPGPTLEPGGHGAGQAGPEPHFKVDADISALAAALGQLQQLQQRDPVKARQVLAAIAARLEEHAGPSRLAGCFRQAAESGSLEPLQPSRLFPGPDATARPHGVQSYGAQAPPFDLAGVIEDSLRQAGVPERPSRRQGQP